MYGPCNTKEVFNRLEFPVTRISDKSYTKEGIRQGGKMFWGGAFAMKSAIRQSSFDAYKKVFENLRNDLNHALHQ